MTHTAHSEETRASTASNWVERKNELEVRITRGIPAPEGVTELSLGDIEIVDEVFQHRSNNMASSSNHCRELTKRLKAGKGLAFDPLVVFWVGDGWVLVDGHHRVEAYQGVQFTQPVPVIVFDGSLDDAINEALRGNSKDKLSMTSREKSNAAWRLTVGTDLRVFQIVESSKRSKPTIIKMRLIKDELLQKKLGINLANLSWDDAQRVHKGLSPEIPHDDDWMEQQAQALARKMMSTLGAGLGKQPEVFLMALEIYDGRLVDYLRNECQRDDDDDELDF